MNRILLALLSAGLFGGLTLWISVWICIKIEKRWPSNDLLGTGIPSGCVLIIVSVLSIIGAIVGFWLSWGDLC